MPERAIWIAGSRRERERMRCLLLQRTSAVCWLLVWPAFLQSATFTVSTTADSGAGSLRQALLSANLSPGADTIRFNLAGITGVRTIAPRTELPAITGPLSVDGSSQPGFAGRPLIQLSGSNAVGAAGLRIRAD